MTQTTAKTERRFPALAVSRGIGIGRVVFLHGEKRQWFRVDLDAAQSELEIQRVMSAVDEAAGQLRELAVASEPDSKQNVSTIFGVHQLILEESSLVKKIVTVIREQRVNAEWALKVVSDHYSTRQRSIPDPDFREKHLDIEDVADRLFAALSGPTSHTHLPHPAAVVVARELRPSAIMELSRSTPAGLITERGGWTSHASILAREFKLPMVSGLRNLDNTLSDGDYVIVDGIDGQVIVNPTSKTLESLQSANRVSTIPELARAGKGNAITTLDGTEMVIRANLDLPAAYSAALLLGARGVGLFRSESLISRSGGVPSEDEQVSAYRELAEATGEFGVKIRTFDSGIDEINFEDSSFERNPSLGLRSIRLSLTDSRHFRVQIRAVLRASVGRTIDMVLPMVSGVDEISRSRAIIDEERINLSEAGIPIGQPGLGAMIEVPSAVLTARDIAGKVDFLCLGTNDLVQYILAVDRDNDAVADWYQTLHPGVIRAIGEVISAAGAAAIPVSVCGEMAGSPFYVPILLGLGARELSMNVNSIQQIRRLISAITVAETKALVEQAKKFETADEIETYLREHYREHWSHLFPPGLLEAKHR